MITDDDIVLEQDEQDQQPATKKLKAVPDPDLALRISNLFATGSLTTSTIGLGNVNNTSDVNKPVSTAQQTALNLKVDKTTTVNTYPLSSNIALVASDIGLGNVNNTSDVNKPVSTAQQTALNLKVDKTTTVNSKALSTNIALVASDIGLGNVNNTSDANKPVSTAQQTALNLKVDKTTTVNTYPLSSNIALVASDIGLGNVNNTSDANKPVSTAQQTALNLKQDLSAKGIANGYASLDSTSKLTASQLPAISLNSLSNVAISSVQNGQYLTYNSTSSAWSNTSGGGGGGVFQLNGQNQAYALYTTGIGTSTPQATLDVENSSSSASSTGLVYGVTSCSTDGYGYAQIMNLVNSTCTMSTCTIIVNGTTYTIPASVISGLVGPLYYIFADALSLSYLSNVVPPSFETDMYFQPGAYLNFENGLYDPHWNAWTNQVAQQLSITNTRSKFGSYSWQGNASDALVLPVINKYCTESRARMFLGAFPAWQVDFWIYVTAIGTAATDIYNYRTAFRSGFGIVIQNTAASLNLIAYISSNGTSWDVANGLAIGSLTLNTWCNVAISYTGVKFVTYVNGTTKTIAMTNNLPNSSSAITMYHSFGPFAGTAPTAFIDEIIMTPYLRTFAATAAFTPSNNAIVGAPFAAYLNGTNLTPTDGYNLNWYALDIYGLPGGHILPTSPYPGSNQTIKLTRFNTVYTPLAPNLQMCAEWTLEFQCILFTIPAVTNIVDMRNTQFDCSLVIQATNGTTMSTYLSSNGTSWNIASGSTITVTNSTWFHMAITFSATRGGYSIYKNGVRITNVVSTSLLAPTSCIKLGNNPQIAAGSEFGINDFRISPFLVYTGASFTPPTTSLVGINASRDIINLSTGACTTQGVGASTSNKRVYIGSVRTDLQREKHWIDRMNQQLPIASFGSGALSVWGQTRGFSSAQSSFSLPSQPSNSRNFMALVRQDGALIIGGDWSISDGVTGVPTPAGTWDQYVPMLSQRAAVSKMYLSYSKYVYTDVNNVVWGCGYNPYGSFGVGTTTTQTRPIPIYYASSTPVIYLTTMYIGSIESMFIIDSGTGNMYSAGSNGVGQLGQGTTTQQNTLTLVPKQSGQNWYNVWQFGQVTFAITDAASNYTLYACGSNAGYALAVGSSTANFTTFTQCIYPNGTAVTNVKNVVGNYQTSTPNVTVSILLNDGTVYVSGRVTTSSYWTPGLGQFGASPIYGFAGPICSNVASIAGTGGDDDPTLLVLRNDKTVWWLNGIGAGLLTSTGSTYSTSFQRAFFSMGEFIPISRLVANSNASYHQCCLFPQDGTVLLSGGGNTINNSMAGPPPLSSTIYVPNEINFYGEPIVDCYLQNTTDGTTVYSNTFLTTLAGKVYSCGTKYTALAGQLANKTTFVPLCLPFQ